MSMSISKSGIAILKSGIAILIMSMSISKSGIPKSGIAIPDFNVTLLTSKIGCFTYKTIDLASSLIRKSTYLISYGGRTWVKHLKMPKISMTP